MVLSQTGFAGVCNNAGLYFVRVHQSVFFIFFFIWSLRNVADYNLTDILLNCTGHLSQRSNSVHSETPPKISMKSFRVCVAVTTVVH